MTKIRAEENFGPPKTRSHTFMTSTKNDQFCCKYVVSRAFCKTSYLEKKIDNVNK